APFAIGMTVTICILAFGDLTGGSVNPARTLGPAIATGIYQNILVYFAAQIVGCLAAGGLYRLFWGANPTLQSRRVAVALRWTDCPGRAWPAVCRPHGGRFKIRVYASFGINPYLEPTPSSSPPGVSRNWW